MSGTSTTGSSRSGWVRIRTLRTPFPHPARNHHRKGFHWIGAGFVVGAYRGRRHGRLLRRYVQRLFRALPQSRCFLWICAASVEALRWTRRLKMYWTDETARRSIGQPGRGRGGPGYLRHGPLRLFFYRRRSGRQDCADVLDRQDTKEVHRANLNRIAADLHTSGVVLFFLFIYRRCIGRHDCGDVLGG